MPAPGPRPGHAAAARAARSESCSNRSASATSSRNAWPSRHGLRRPSSTRARRARRCPRRRSRARPGRAACGSARPAARRRRAGRPARARSPPRRHAVRLEPHPVDMMPRRLVVRLLAPARMRAGGIEPAVVPAQPLEVGLLARRAAARRAPRRHGACGRARSRRNDCSERALVGRDQAQAVRAAGDAAQILALLELAVDLPRRHLGGPCRRPAPASARCPSRSSCASGVCPARPPGAADCGGAVGLALWFPHKLGWPRRCRLRHLPARAWRGGSRCGS